MKIARASGKAALTAALALSFGLTGCGADSTSPAMSSTSSAPSTPSAPSSPSTPATVTVGGTVTGLTAGQSVSIELNAGNTQTITGMTSGAPVPFSFPAIATSSAYSVAVQNRPTGIF